MKDYRISYGQSEFAQADRCLIWKVQPSFFRERKKAKKASLAAAAAGRTMYLQKVEIEKKTFRSPAKKSFQSPAKRV